MPKNIVVCYDGTGNEFGPHNTNVVRTFQAMMRDHDQVGFYDPGIGTFSIVGRYLGKSVGTFLCKVFGYGLRKSIEDGYKYLMEYYEEGDRLFLFGFSRGAFAARALGGMLHDIGLLERGSVNLVPYATRLYLSDDRHFGRGFRRTYCHDCKPCFVGVWDTVATLGLVLGRRFPDHNLNEDVPYGCQAVAIDETRRQFPVSLWVEADLQDHQRVDQVWFRGAHSDIGGGYPQRGLSDIALIWMLEKAEAHGLRLRPGWRARLSPDPLADIHDSRTGLWRLWPAVQRPIPEGARIHESVRVRMKACPDEAVPPLPADHVFVGHTDPVRRARPAAPAPGEPQPDAAALREGREAAS